MLDGRPVDFPHEPSASVRMVGHRATGGPYAKNSSMEPRRGEIWPAKVEDISLPPAGTKNMDMRKISKDLKWKFDNFTTQMLRSPEERGQDRLDQQEEKEPYVDSNIRERIYDLTARMARSGMLRGC